MRCVRVRNWPKVRIPHQMWKPIYKFNQVPMYLTFASNFTDKIMLTKIFKYFFITNIWKARNYCNQITI